MKIVTWNANYEDRWSNIRDLLTTSGAANTPADVICLQEVGDVRPIWVERRKPTSYGDFSLGWYTWNMGGTHHPMFSKVRHCSWGQSNKRCSMAIIWGCTTKDPGRWRVPDSYDVEAEASTRRPMIGIRLPLNNVTDVLVSCVHFVASNAAATSAVPMLNLLSSRITHWITAGDYNCEPQDLAVAALPDRGRWTIRSPGWPTHLSPSGSARTLDYFTASSRRAAHDPAIVVSNVTTIGMGGSDHYPVSCTIHV